MRRTLRKRGGVQWSKTGIRNVSKGTHERLLGVGELTKFSEGEDKTLHEWGSYREFVSTNKQLEELV